MLINTNKIEINGSADVRECDMMTHLKVFRNGSFCNTVCNKNNITKVR